MIRLVTREWKLLPALLLTTLTFAVAQGMVVPALPAIAARFDATGAEATWVLSVNLVTTALSLPLGGWLGDEWGRRRVLLAALALFAAGGVIAAAAPNLLLLVLGRALQGVGGGVYPLGFGLAREFLPIRRHANAIALLSVSVGIGGAAGLPIGGVVVDRWSYHWILWGNAGAAIVALSCTALAVPSARAARRRMTPVIDLAGLRSRQVLLTNVATVLVGMGNFALMVAVTQIAQAGGGGLGMSATAAGLLLLPGSLVMIPIGAAAGGVAARVGNRRLLALGGALTGVGFASGAVWHGDGVALTTCAVVVFAGVGLALAAATGLILEVVPARRTGEATGLNGLARIAGSALGAPVVVALLSIGSPAAGIVLSRSVAIVFWGCAALMLLAVAVVAGLPKSSAKS
jgi:MFS family permease